VSANLRSAISGILAETAKRIEPDLTHLEEALGEQVEAGSFALGMMAATLTMMNMNTLDAVRLMPDGWRVFLENCRAREQHDGEPWRKGRLIGPYERVPDGQVFPEGTHVRWRPVNDGWTEITLPDGTVRWVRVGIVEAIS
jgi:hypothetical protein